MNSANAAHEFTEGKLKRRAGGSGRIEFWMVCWGSRLPMHFSGQQLGNPYAPGPGHEDPGESELPDEW